MKCSIKQKTIHHDDVVRRLIVTCDEVFRCALSIFVDVQCAIAIRTFAQWDIKLKYNNAILSL